MKTPKRDLLTGFEYPFYDVTADVWNFRLQEYDRIGITITQTYEEALSIVRKIQVNKNTAQAEIHEETYDTYELITIKVAVTDDPRGYIFYDPRTEKDIEEVEE